MTLRIDRPEVGYFRIKQVRGGPWIAARIYRSVARDPDTGELLDRSPVMLAELNGKFVDAYDLWPRVAGNNISEAEYKFLRADSKWAQENAPDDPAANLDQAINLSTLPAILPPGVK